nr:hypothetical protein [Stenotrophomonas pavanii]
MQVDNPAGRLLSIVERGHRIKHQDSCRESWAILLDVPANDQSLLMQRVSLVMALPARISDVLKADFPMLYESNAHQHVVSCLNKAFINQHMAGNWASFIGHVDGHVASNLKFMSQLFETSRPSKAMSSEEILDIRARTEALINIVISGDFPPAMKKSLVDKLKAVIDALDSYYVFGAEPVLNAVAATIGAAYLSPDYRAAANTEAGKEFASSLANLANAVTVATAVVQLGISSVPLLEFAVKTIVGNP